jgi:hypothetical protein
MIQAFEFQVVINYNQYHYVTNRMSSIGVDEEEALQALRQKLLSKMQRLSDKRGQYKIESIKRVKL